MANQDIPVFMIDGVREYPAIRRHPVLMIDLNQIVNRVREQSIFTPVPIW